ncbi:MAG: hypothetical protein MI922_00940 [Bacteroidales bacterium]|nr:hypothetical protein [Bacteroidales bacterium]
MMTWNFLPILVSVFLPVFSLFSQDLSATKINDKSNIDFYVFRLPRVEIPNKTLQTHYAEGYFGVELESKFRYFIDMYTNEEPIEDIIPSSKIEVIKPEIYTAVVRLYHYYNEGSKKGKIEKIEAINRWEHVLDVGLSLMHNKSAILEKHISETDNVFDLTFVFKRVRLTD